MVPSAAPAAASRSSRKAGAGKAPRKSRKKPEPAHEPTVSYSWANPFIERCGADPGKVHDELEALRLKSTDRTIRPDDVVEWARSHTKSELHKAFPWDDSVAAALYRRSLARTIVRSIRVVYSNGETTTERVYVRPPSESGYQPIESLSNTAAASVKRRAIDDLRNWLNRYSDIVSKTGVRDVVDTLIEKLSAEIG